MEELYSLQLYDFGDTNWSVQNNLTSKDSIGHQIVSEGSTSMKNIQRKDQTTFLLSLQAASDSTVNLFMDNRETNIDGIIATAVFFQEE